MRKVFLDTNVLIDYLEKRNDTQAAKAIIQLGHAGFISVHASILTFANMAYVLHSVHKRTKSEIYEALEATTELVDVLPMDKKQLEAAIMYRAKDFEDMLQYQCAMANHCDVIVTRNVKDFKTFSSLPLMTPADFVSAMTD